MNSDRYPGIKKEKNYHVHVQILIYIFSHNFDNYVLGPVHTKRKRMRGEKTKEKISTMKENFRFHPRSR